MKNVHFENKKASRAFFWFLWLTYVFVYLTKSCFNSAMAFIVNDGVMTKSQTGFITAAFYLVYAPLQVIGGASADKYDPVKLIKIGLFGGAVANLIIFLNQNYYLVLIVWVLNAVVQFALWPSIFKIISSQLINEDKNKSTYYMSFAATVGLLLAYLVAAIVPKWTYNFALSAVLLFLLMFAMCVFEKKLGKFTVPDAKPVEGNLTSNDDHQIPTLKIFLLSGFLILIVVVLIKYVVSNSIATLSATMLMESYESVTPAIGNLLNMLIIAAGVLGTILAKTVLYPKIIKSIPLGIFYMMLFGLIGSVVLKFVGKINIIVILISLCVMYAAFSAMILFVFYCNLSFAKFGKSGTAAGVANAAASFGIVVNNYGVTWVAERYGWTTVTNLFVVLLIIALALCIIFVCFWNNFSKKNFIS